MARVKVSLTLNFTTPPSVGAGGATETLADKVVTRDAHGRFIIPASQVKGKLRHACEQLVRTQYAEPDRRLCRPPRPMAMCPHAELVDAAPCLLCQIFGSPQYRCRLRFHDLIATVEDAPEQTLRPMVSLNRARRAAEAQRLFLVETAPHIAGLSFAHSEAITGHLQDEAHAHVLLAGFKLLFAWGGSSSRGLGWGQAAVEAWLDNNPEPIKLDVEQIRLLCRS